MDGKEKKSVLLPMLVQLFGKESTPGKSRFSSGRQVKRACGLCVCLAGALMEVMSFGFWYLSNPDHSYVKCWRVHASFGEDLWCLKKGRLMRKLVVLS